MKTKRGDKSIGFIAPSAGPRTLSLELSVLPNSGGQCSVNHTMELRGIEPLTSAVRLQRSTN
jgi:hypothetical protein